MYRVTFECTDRKLGIALRNLTGSGMRIIEQRYFEDVKPKANGKLARVEPNDFVILGTPFKRREGTMPDIMIGFIERHEQKHGAGSMTRADLTEKLEEYSDAPGAVITAGLSRGIIKGVKNDG